jgi:hypothetical protein
LSKPWKLPATKISKHHSKPTKENVIATEPEKSKPNNSIIDFNTLPPYAHSIRNLKLLVLSHINTLQRFTPAELLSLDHIHNAATCVARRDIAKQITERDVTNMLLAALNLLLRDGNIIIPRSHQQINEYIKQEAPPATTDETFVVVGTWNLGSTVKSVAKRDGKVTVRDLWRKVMSWGSGWEATTKGVIGVVVEDVLTRIEGQEWVESKPGVWTKLDM